jgi:NADH-quinone oxidoreductase subunit M
VLALSVVAIIYGAYMALAQADLKKLIAYSSVSHMGFVTLGLFVFTVQGIEGAMLQMVNHGITTGALFLCVGILYDRTHSRLIADYGGVAKTMPLYAAMLVIFSLSSLGLPGTNSFVGEFLVLLGAFITRPAYAVAASLGVILAAVYMLWMVQRVLFGEANPKNAGHPDLGLRELATVAPLVVAVFWIGLYPGPVLDVLHASVNHLIDQTRVGTGSQAALSWSDLLWSAVRAVLPS